MRRVYQNQIFSDKRKVRKAGREDMFKTRAFLENVMTTLPVNSTFLENVSPLVGDWVGNLLNHDSTTFPDNWPRANIFSEEPFNYSVDMRVKTEYSYGKLMPIDSTHITLSQGRFDQLSDLLWEPFNLCGYNTLGKLIGVCRDLQIDPNTTLEVLGQLNNEFFSVSEKYLSYLYDTEVEGLNKELISRLEKYAGYENGAFYLLIILVKLGVINFLNSVYVSKGYLKKFVEESEAFIDGMTDKIVLVIFSFTGIFNLREIMRFAAGLMFMDIMYDSPTSQNFPQNIVPTDKDFCISPDLVKGAETMRLDYEKKKTEYKAQRRIERKKKKVLEDYKKLGLDKEDLPNQIPVDYVIEGDEDEDSTTSTEGVTEDE